MSPSRVGRWGLVALSWLGAAAAFAAPVAAPGPLAATEGTSRWTPFRQFSHHDGLLQSRAYALAQDADGFIWAATELGLARYDAQRWVEVPLDPPYPRVSVKALSALADGSVWAGTDSRGLFRWHQGRFVHFVAKQGLGSDTILALAADGADAVWVGTTNGAARCDADGCREIAAAHEIEISALLAGSDATGNPVLWLGGSDNRVLRIEQPRGEQRLAALGLSSADGLPGGAIYALAQWGGKHGRDLWIGTAHGLTRYDGERLVAYDRASGFPDVPVRGLVPWVDERGAPWLAAATLRGGLILLGNDGRWRQIGEAQGLPENALYSVIATHLGNEPPQLWLGSSAAGILRLERDRWQSFDTRMGLPQRAVMHLGVTRFPEDRTRGIWLGTLDGSVRWRDGAWRPWLPEPLRNALILSVAESAPDQLWIGSDRGLARLHGGKVEHLWTPDDSALPGKTVAAVLPWREADGHETLWLATNAGLAKSVDGKIERVAEATPQRPGTPVRALLAVQDPSGHRLLLVGSDNGLDMFDGASWRVAPGDCVPPVAVEDLKSDPAQPSRYAWAAHDNGVTRISLERLAAGEWICQRLTQPQYPIDAVFQIVFAPPRTYLFGPNLASWFVFDSGAPDDLDKIHLESFDEQDGLPTLEFNRAAARDVDGRIWVGTNAGAAVYEPGAPTSAAHAPRPLRLLRASALGTGRTLESGDVLGSDDNNVEFEVALLSYHREQRNRYRAQLQGLESRADRWVADARWTYRRLPSGDYVYRVWGRDADGVESGPIEFAFSVAVPLWRQPWVIGLAGLLLIGVGSASGRWRTSMLARRATELEEEVAARTEELAGANQRLEQASLTDALTGLYNRRYFSREMPGEIERAVYKNRERTGAPRLLIALIDIDHFKEINDGAGHAAGDAVLSALAERLRAGCGEKDMLLRWGGEEFLLIRRDVAVGDADNQVRAVLSRITDNPFAWSDRRLNITCSIGFALFPWREGQPLATTVDHLLTLADHALYRAKAAGRNCACAARWDPDGETLVLHPELTARWDLIRAEKLSAADKIAPAERPAPAGDAAPAPNMPSADLASTAESATSAAQLAPAEDTAPANNKPPAPIK